MRTTFSEIFGRRFLGVLEKDSKAAIKAWIKRHSESIKRHSDKAVEAEAEAAVHRAAGRHDEAKKADDLAASARKWLQSYGGFLTPDKTDKPVSSFSISDGIARLRDSIKAELEGKPLLSISDKFRDALDRSVAAAKEKAKSEKFAPEVPGFDKMPDHILFPRDDHEEWVEERLKEGIQKHKSEMTND
jgi:hypothetical protein